MEFGVNMLWQTDDFGELTPPDQDTLSSSEDQIPGGRHGGIFEIQAIRAKSPLANAVHQLNARYGGGRVPETFEARHRVCSVLYVAMVLLAPVVETLSIEPSCPQAARLCANTCTTTLRATGLSLGGEGRRFFPVSVKTCRNLASSRLV